MKMKQRSILLALGVFLVFSLAGVSFGQGDIFVKDGLGTVSKQKWAPGEIIVKFKAGVSQDVIRQMNQTHGNSVLSISKRGKFSRLRISKNRTVEEMVSIYSQNPNVEYAEPNFIVSALFTPDDTYYYPYQWNLHDSPGGINMESAWDISQGENVIVAVLDTGVAYENTNGRNRYKLAPDLANTTFVPGWDFINNDSHPNDDNSHGTHVTGTIAQSTHNGMGTAGVAYKASIMPVKVLDSTGFGTDANVADGIYYAADNGAKVINMSLGGTDQSTKMEDALEYAYNRGVTIVCGAGNSYLDGNPTFYPAAYDAYCIAVGATQYDETRAFYSGTGTFVDIAAPGGNLYFDQNGDGYGDGILQQTFNPNSKNTSDFGYWFFQGTSMATPHVAGVAALLIANGITGPDNVRLAIESTAKDLGSPGWDVEHGWGLVNAYAALNYVPQEVHDVAVTDISVPSPLLPGIVSVNVNVANQGTLEESFEVTMYVDGVQVGESQLVSSLPARGTTSLEFNWSAVVIGPHTLRAEVSEVLEETNTANNSMVATVTVIEPRHDVAVMLISAPLDATQGDFIQPVLWVVNYGTYSETTTVSLYDETYGVPIDSSLTLDIDVGDLAFIMFDWDTTGASIGEHTIRGEASIADEDADTLNNSMTTTTTIKQVPDGPTMHISDISMSLRQKGPNYQAIAKVTVLDRSGSVVDGATVTGEWVLYTPPLTVTPLNSISGDTNGKGKAKLSSSTVKATSGDYFIVTITGVIKDGYLYDLTKNVESSDGIVVP
jgi:serine protease